MPHISERIGHEFADEAAREEARQEARRSRRAMKQNNGDLGDEEAARRVEEDQKYRTNRLRRSGTNSLAPKPVEKFTDIIRSLKENNEEAVRERGRLNDKMDKICSLLSLPQHGQGEVPARAEQEAAARTQLEALKAKRDQLTVEYNALEMYRNQSTAVRSRCRGW